MSDATPVLWSVRAGTVPYDDACRMQRELAAARISGRIPDVLLLLEHPPVLTKGRRTDPRELGMGEDWYRMQGIEVADADRGGRVTYHGPGQLVAYPIVDLTALGGDGSADVAAYVAALERAMIAALAAHGVAGQVFEGLNGVWTAGQPPIPVRRERSARSEFTSAAGSRPTASPSTSATTCSRSSGSFPAGWRRRG
jgi:lipoyl(octanoyl) transferase